jgi:hypothetical protein
MWVHYDKGLQLEVIPRAIDVLGTGVYPSAAELALVHADGSRYLSWKQIAGRKTLVGTAGPVHSPGGSGPRGNPGPNVSWVENGDVYRLLPCPPHPVALQVLLEVAGSIR